MSSQAIIGTVVTTRPRGQSITLQRMLAQHGVNTFEFPLLEIAPIHDDDAALAHAFSALEQYSLVIFSSPNAIHYALAFLPNRGWPHQVPIGVVGPGSAYALESHGIAAPNYRLISPCLNQSDQAPCTEAYGSEALVSALEHTLGLASLAGQRILIVRADRGREWLAKVLDTHHARVETIVVYRCTPTRPSASQWTKIHTLLAGQPHAWLLSSSTSVRHLVHLARTQLNTHDQIRLKQAPVVAPHTRIAHTASAAGFVRIMQSGLSSVSMMGTLLASIRSFSCAYPYD